VKPENIRQGLRTFDATYFQAPGRMNVFDDLPFKVILDYGHNPAAVQAMADLVAKLECSGRRICVLAGPGDRRDEDIRDIAKIAARANFDLVVLRRDDDLRGRASDEVPRMMEKQMLAEGFPAEKIKVIPDEQEAIDFALTSARRGDLLLVFADAISRSWKQIIYFKPAGEEAKKRTSSAPPPPPGHEMGAPPPPKSAADLFPGEAIIHDERGVRLAKESDD
jgi:cyanophycin synthetase